jgi:hypothetical protein
LQGTVGIIPTLSVALHPLPGIEDAYLYGSLAKNEEDGSSDIDLLILGHPDSLKFTSCLIVSSKAKISAANFSSRRPICGDDMKGISFVADVDFCNGLAIA